MGKIEHKKRNENRQINILFSPSQLRAAFIACSNYTPPVGEKWRQRSQSQAATKLREAFVILNLNQ